jgi:hypothetical protein
MNKSIPASSRFIRAIRRIQLYFRASDEVPHVFLLDIERNLGRLLPILQSIIELTAEGCSTVEIASQIGQSHMYVHVKIDGRLWVGSSTFIDSPFH